MTRSDPYEIARLVGDELDRANVAWFVGGSLASSLHGEPRATNDIDLVADLDEATARRLGPALGPDFSVDEEALLVAVRRRRAAQLYYLPALTKIDLFAAGHAPFDRVELERRRLETWRTGMSIWVKSAEDSVLRKLLWYRAGGEVSGSQWRDVVSILRLMRGRLEWAHLRRWSGELGLDELLARATLEAGPPPG